MSSSWAGKGAWRPRDTPDWSWELMLYPNTGVCYDEMLRSLLYLEIQYFNPEFSLEWNPTSLITEPEINIFFSVVNKLDKLH